MAPFREKRISINNYELKDIILEGSNVARKVAQNTLEEVREAMGLRYISIVKDMR